MVRSDSQPSIGAPTLRWATVVDLPPGGAVPPTPGPEGATAAPEIAVIVIDEDAPESGSVLGRAAYEIWTRNRVYRLDAALTCLEVTCRDTGLAEAGARFRGTQLVGARRRVGDAVEFWRPLPVPGSVAIFASNGRASLDSLTTSAVERVVVRQKVRRLPAYGVPVRGDEAEV